jgi:hypothetical protein
VSRQPDPGLAGNLAGRAERLIFGVDMLGASRRAHYRTLVGDMIVAYLTTPE